MLLWFISIALGLCMWGSFYLSFLALKAGESPWLFAGFGVLFSIPCLMIAFKLAAKRWPAMQRIEEALFRHSKPRTTFVSHWFMMAALVLTGVIVMAAILVPIFFK